MINHDIHGVLGLVGLLVAGCGGNFTSEFPPGLEPLDPETKAGWPAGTADDPHPEQINVASGTTDGLAWVHAAAFVRAPLGELWQAMRTPEVCVDRRKVSSFAVTRDVETGFDDSYRIHNVVNGIITVEFENTWRHGVIEGSKEQPTAIAARYQKTWGTAFIEVLDGSFVARRVDDQTSSLVMMEHLKATGQGPETAVQTIRDYHASVLARVHMRPLPTY
jgi:hypothetical protein